MKVFCTGLQRTGTTSLSRALRLLRLRTLDCPVELFKNVDDPVVHEHDAFTDNPVPLLYRELDQRHPGARFIHTERDEEGWLRSVEWLFTVGAVKFAWDRHPEFHEFHRALYGTTRFEAETFRATYRRHNAEVRAHFADRPDDLLLMDISRGDGFDKLCPFLGLDAPSAPFPHGNRQEGMWRVRLRRLFRRVVPRRGPAS